MFTAYQRLIAFMTNGTLWHNRPLAASSLPDAFHRYDLAIPELLQRGELIATLLALPAGEALPECADLADNALLYLSVKLWALYRATCFEYKRLYQQYPTWDELPQGVSEMLEALHKRFGMPLTPSYVEDFWLNATGDGEMIAPITGFTEEITTVTVVGASACKIFAKAPEELGRLKQALCESDDSGVIQSLNTFTGYIRDLTKAFTQLSPARCDIVRWWVSFAAMGGAVHLGDPIALPNNGGDAPPFHLLDALLGHESSENDPLSKVRASRVAVRPPALSALCDELMSHEPSLRGYLQQRDNAALSAAFGKLTKTYHQLLEYHRRIMVAFFAPQCPPAAFLALNQRLLQGIAARALLVNAEAEEKDALPVRQDEKTVSYKSVLKGILNGKCVFLVREKAYQIPAEFSHPGGEQLITRYNGCTDTPFLQAHTPRTLARFQCVGRVTFSPLGRALEALLATKNALEIFRVAMRKEPFIPCLWLEGFTQLLQRYLLAINALNTVLSPASSDKLVPLVIDTNVPVTLQSFVMLEGVANYMKEVLSQCCEEKIAITAGQIHAQVSKQVRMATLPRM